MSETLSGKLAEGVFSFALGKGKEKAASFVVNKQDEQELKKAIRTFLDDFCKKELPYLSLDEEFDFDGFSGFLLSRQERLEEYFYVEVDGRSAVLEVLRSEALAYAQPRGQSGRRLVLGCLDAVLATIESVLLKRVDKKDWFLAARTEEQLRQAVEKIVQEQAERIHSHIDYKGSFAELVDNLETELPDDDRAYHYRNSKIGFFGREKELKYLDEFLEDAEQFLYTVITGPGGIGKSKLMYHYVRINERDGDWKMLYPSRDVMEELYSHKNEFFYPKNLLIVVDYVGQYPENIGKWMAKVLENKHRPHKMRVVLLERPNPEHEALPEWYKKLVDRRKRLEGRFFQKRFYEMELLGRESLLALMDNIAGQENKILTEQEKQEIYERVCSFRYEGEGGSPLYTILTTDAFLNGIPLTSLDTNKLMEYVLDRDEEYWETTICGGDEDLYRCFREMLVYATATGGWDFTPLGEPLTEEAERLRKVSRQGKTAVLQKFSGFVTENDEGKLILNPLEPDLIGEYFVLKFLLDQVADERYQQRISLFWEKPLPYTYFLYRCVDSYLAQKEFGELLDGEKTVFWYKRGNYFAVTITAGLLFNLSNQQDILGRMECVYRLSVLEKQYAANEEIALLYAKGIFNLSNRQELKEHTESANRLEILSKKHSENTDILYIYAKNIANLIMKQDSALGKISIEKLYGLLKKWDGYTGQDKIAIEYARGLFNLSNHQNLSERIESISQLEELTRKYETTAEIALMYASGLVNLIAEQGDEPRVGNVEKLRILSEEQYAGNVEIAFEYAKGLTWFWAKKYTEDLAIREYQAFYAEWQSNPEVAKRAACAEPDSTMRNLKCLLLEHTELFSKFMEKFIS